MDGSGSMAASKIQRPTTHNFIIYPLRKGLYRSYQTLGNWQEHKSSALVGIKKQFLFIAGNSESRNRAIAKA